MSNKRITWIDSVKGLAIILLLFSHSMAQNDLLKNWIFAFHMPIFFIICGYLVNLKYSDGFKKGQFLDLLSKRWYNLFKPYFFFGIILIIFLNILRFYAGEKLNFPSLFLDLISMKGIESLWFLPIYFFSEIFLIFILGKTHGKYRYMAILLIIVILSFINQPALSYPFSILYKIASGSVFVFAGYIFASNKIDELLPIKLLIPLLFIASLSTFLNNGASMNNLKIAPLYFINAIVISLCFISLVRILGNKYGHNKFLTFYGKNSIIIVCTNNLIIETVRLIDYRITNNFMLHSGYLGVFMFFIIITLCEYPFLKVFEGKFKRK